MKWDWESGCQSDEFPSEKMLKANMKMKVYQQGCLLCKKPHTLVSKRKCCFRSSHILIWIFLGCYFECLFFFPIFFTESHVVQADFCFPSAGITVCVTMPNLLLFFLALCLHKPCHAVKPGLELMKILLP